MRFFFFPLALISFSAWSAPCTEADLVLGANLTCDSLIVSTQKTITGPGMASGRIVVNVLGNVEINADIILDGAHGLSNVSSGNGGIGGPGAGDGGGYSFGSTEDAGIDDGFGGKFTDNPDGKTFTNQTPCSSGGGGGGFANNGQSGSKCATSTNPNNGGDSATTFDFTLGQFRGGYGGGAGAYGSSSTTASLGGGGGGAIYIKANGTITIRQGVRISARGGNGGPHSSDGGGGGAGSGGAIWLESVLGINNQGILDTRGGTGGRNNSTGAHGGNGSDGRYRLDSAGAIQDGTGLKEVNSKKLSSDISCGTIAAAKQNENKNLTLQLMMGFMLAMILGSVIKILFRFRAIA